VLKNILNDSDHEKFKAQGFLIARGLFSATEIHKLREYIIQTDFGKGDLFCDPVIRDVIADERLCAIASQLLGETPVYYGDSGVGSGTPPGRWHKDNSQRYQPEAEDWSEDFRIIRFGIYFQDHAEHSGGLAIRAGSHLHADNTSGKPVYIDTKPGDIVFWHFRTTHRASTSLLKGLKVPVLNQKIDRYVVPEWLKIPMEDIRMSMFITYAAPGPAYERNIDYMATRSAVVAKAKATDYAESMFAGLDPQRLVFRDERKRFTSLPEELVHKKHKEFDPAVQAK